MLRTVMATHEPCSPLLTDSPAVKEEAQKRAPAAGLVTYLLTAHVPLLGGIRLAHSITDQTPIDAQSPPPIVLRL